MTENLLVSLNDIEEKEASWLVPQRMPKGQIIILAGDGGSGKTSCWCSLAAAISTGAQVFLPGVPEQIQPTMFVGCGTRADQGDFECKIKNRVPVSLPCVPDRDGNSANRKVIVLSFIASLL